MTLKGWPLTHWGRVMHICAGKLTIIGSDNGLSPGRRQAIIWTNAVILLFGPLGTNFSENLIGIQTFSFKKMPLKMSSVKWHPFCLGLNVLTFQMWILSTYWNKICSSLCLRMSSVLTGTVLNTDSHTRFLKISMAIKYLDYVLMHQTASFTMANVAVQVLNQVVLYKLNISRILWCIRNIKYRWIVDDI